MVEVQSFDSDLMHGIHETLLIWFQLLHEANTKILFLRVASVIGLMGESSHCVCLAFSLRYLVPTCSKLEIFDVPGAHWKYLHFLCMKSIFYLSEAS